MSMYNKLFTKILDSSIWMEPTPTRIVWLTFIAAMDEDGMVQFASVANVAHRAVVTLEEAEAAIKALESPDENSSDPDNEGRRIERVDGGWMVLNAHKYRELVTRAIIKEQTRIRVARFRDKKGNADVTQELRTPFDTDTDNAPDSEEKGSAEGKRKKGEDLDKWIEKIREAYPRKGSQQDCRYAIRTALDAAHQTPEQILADVQACAVWVKQAEAGGTCSFVPTAKAFFCERQWTEPQKFEGIAINVKAAQNGTAKTQRRDSGDLNADDRYTRKPS